MSKRGWESRSARGTAWAAPLVFVAVACGPPSTALRVPAADEVDVLRRCLAATAPRVGFEARGKAHFESGEGAVDGDVEVRVAPPERAWLQLRTRALFSLVGARFVTALPGDGFLVTYAERGDDVQRLPFAASVAADLSPGGGPAALLDVAMGRLPQDAWGTGDIAGRTWVAGSEGQRFYRIDAASGGPPGHLHVWLADDTLRKLQWWVGSELRLEVLYDRYEPVGGVRLPTRLQVRAPKARLRARVDLEHLQPRESFAPADFEVGRLWNPVGDRGVSHG